MAGTFFYFYRDAFMYTQHFDVALGHGGANFNYTVE